MHSLRRLLPALALLTLLALPAAAPAQTWLPLQTGFFWSYAGVSEAEIRTVEGSVEVRGVPCQAILYSPSTNNEQLRNFWTTDPDGDIYLHGFSRPDFEGWEYDPPIRLVDTPLFVGKTWQQSIDFYPIGGGPLQFTEIIAFEVCEEGIVAVPAGTFDTFGISQTDPTVLASEAGPLRVDGTFASVGRSAAPSYYAQDVGVVREIFFETLDLLAYGAPTDLTVDTWAGVKNLYR